MKTQIVMFLVIKESIFGLYQLRTKKVVARACACSCSLESASLRRRTWSRCFRTPNDKTSLPAKPNSNIRFQSRQQLSDLRYSA